MIKFIEKPVPAEVGNIGVVRSFAPDNGGDYRLVEDDKGKWSIFPRRKLSNDEKDAVAVFIMGITTGSKVDYTKE